MNSEHPVGWERSLTPAERAFAPEWEQWRMDMLSDEQVSHCGHLDEHVIVPGCTYCAEIEAHLGHGRFDPRWDCYHCEGWCNVRSDTQRLLRASYFATQAGATWGSWWQVNGQTLRLGGAVADPLLEGWEARAGWVVLYAADYTTIRLRTLALVEEATKADPPDTPWPAQPASTDATGSQ